VTTTIRINGAAVFDVKGKHTSATSTTSNINDIGTPLFSKWTVTAMKAQWFGDVHTSVTKFSSPSCSYGEDQIH
jgi:hypothetical protein